MKSEPRDIQWFHNHNILAGYFLAEWLSNFYPEWTPMKQELEVLISPKVQ